MNVSNTCFKGKCKKGKCEQFCTTKGLLPCLCSEPEAHQCVRCCAKLNTTGSDIVCTPYLDDGQMMQLNESAICVLGYCNEGTCRKHTQDVIQRVWDIFQYIAPDKIGEFLADNIVGAVLVFSLLFWIPCSCLVNFVDKMRLKERHKEEKFYAERGAELNRSFATFMRPIGSISNPTSQRTRVQRNNANWTSSGIVVNSGLNAREQWRASQERGIAMRNLKCRENVQGKLEVVPGSPNDDDAMSQPSLVDMDANGNNRPPLLSGSHPSLVPVSPLSSLNDKSFDGEIKPIAVSSNTNLPALFDQENDITAGPFRHSLKRQEAVLTP